MKTLILIIALLTITATEAFCKVSYIDSYTRRDGTVVQGHWRDTSCDGRSYNNANYMGLN